MPVRLHQGLDPLLVLSDQIEMVTAQSLEFLIIGSRRQTRQLTLRMELDRLHVSQVVEQVLVT
jgi:hypothetical protein